METTPSDESPTAERKYTGPADPIGVWAQAKKEAGIDVDRFIIDDPELMAAVKGVYVRLCAISRSENDLSQVIAKPPVTQA